MITWDEYRKRMKRYNREMHEAVITITVRVFLIALLQCSNQTKRQKLMRRSRNKRHGETETRKDPVFFSEQALRRFTVNENQVTKPYSTKVGYTTWEADAKVKEEEVVTDTRNEELVSKEDVLDVGRLIIWCESKKQNMEIWDSVFWAIGTVEEIRENQRRSELGKKRNFVKGN